MNQSLTYNILNSPGLYDPPVVGQTLTVQSATDIEAESYYIAKKNLKNYNEIPIEKSKVFLNFIAKKVFILDTTIKKVSNVNFSYFVDDTIINNQINIPLIEGMIFRCLGEGLKDLREYTYFLFENNKSRKIPNYRTLEVMLAERGLSYSTIKVLSAIECSIIDTGLDLPSRSNEWSTDLGDSTGFTTLSQLSQNISTLNQITAALQNSVTQEQTNVANQLAAQSAGMQASAAAAQAQASAASAANADAQTALTNAQASAANAQAQADAALAAAVAAQVALANTETGD